MSSIEWNANGGAEWASLHNLGFSEAGNCPQACDASQNTRLMLPTKLILGRPLHVIDDEVSARPFDRLQL